MGDFLKLVPRRAVWMREQRWLVGFCVVCWLESRHRLLGWPGVVRLWQLLVVVQWPKEVRIPSSPTGFLSRNLYICLYLPSDRTWYKVKWPEGRTIVGVRGGEGWAWLSLSLAHLVQCRPDGLSWAWTQTWAQGRMPDYSLNWTARSSAIQGVKGETNAACPSEGGPVQLKPGAFRPQVSAGMWLGRWLLGLYSGWRYFSAGPSKRSSVYSKFLYQI